MRCGSQAGLGRDDKMHLQWVCREEIKMDEKEERDDG
jgi:hypothetical protein